jgi:hypothetical protein
MTDEITQETVIALALRADVAEQLDMVTHGDPNVTHLALAAQLFHSGQALVEYATRLPGHSDAPEHMELAKAMVTAAKAARVALEAAANAVVQLYWVTNNCECERCKTDRRREAAPLN